MKFKAGDVVVHKTSGEKGVVKYDIKVCTFHANNQLCLTDSKNCKKESNGVYKISTNFQTEVAVEECCLELLEKY